MSGVVTGGWSYVIAAYVITGSALLIYATSVLLRYRNEMKRIPQ